MKRFELPVYDKPIFANDASDADNLNFANMTSLIELIDQLCIFTFIYLLAALSRYSNKIFQGLVDRSNSLSKRVHTAADNLKDLQKLVSAKEHNLHQTLDQESDVKPITRSLIDNNSTPMFNETDRPESLSQKQNKCLQNIPNFDYYDQYDNTLQEDQKVAMRFSDPNYFMIQWAEKETQRLKQQAKVPRVIKRKALQRSQANLGSNSQTNVASDSNVSVADSNATNNSSTFNINQPPGGFNPFAYTASETAINPFMASTSTMNPYSTSAATMNPYSTSAIGQTTSSPYSTATGTNIGSTTINPFAPQASINPFAPASSSQLAKNETIVQPPQGGFRAPPDVSESESESESEEEEIVEEVKPKAKPVTKAKAKPVVSTTKKSKKPVKKQESSESESEESSSEEEEVVSKKKKPVKKPSAPPAKGEKVVMKEAVLLPESPKPSADERKHPPNPLLAQIQGFDKHKLKPTEGEGEGGGGSNGEVERPRPPNPLLAQIQGFNKNQLKKTEEESGGGGGGGSSDSPARPRPPNPLLAQIQGFNKNQLKKTEEEEPPVRRPANPLLAQIQGFNKNQLKKTEAPGESNKDEDSHVNRKAVGGGGGNSLVADILKKRMQILGNTQEEDDDDW